MRERLVRTHEVDSVLGLAGETRPALRQQVVAMVTGLGVDILDPPDNVPPTDGDPAGATGPALIERGVCDARLLLRRDRTSPRPWDRLLTASEEVGLAVLLRGDRYLPHEEVPNGYRAGLDTADERARAFDAMVLHNRRLVGFVTGRYVGQGLDPEDLVQHGVIGLMRAVERFDPTRGLKFSTYTVWWIRQAVTRALANEGRAIRLPVHKVDQVRRVVTCRARLLALAGQATVSEICHGLGLGPETVLECLRLHAGMTSLDLLVGDGATPLGEIVTPDPDAMRPDVVAQRRETMTILRASLAALPPRSAAILGWRAGVGTDEPLTLDEIDRRLGISPERVRQLEGRALPQLRDRMRERLGDAVPGAGETVR
ncbi:sigma-70 family RNA polymerase sigma factor [Micromonospora nigra]|uniref:sigma-70 family RNA polymerase sigma factor n=1 Tax=Micromonospora nigra TaxID=145857 RepID=UPI00158681A6|nr:sigma-70 family RNA polymerase sigma factor [Micromonospora nigra]